MAGVPRSAEPLQGWWGMQRRAGGAVLFWPGSAAARQPSLAGQPDDVCLLPLVLPRLCLTQLLRSPLPPPLPATPADAAEFDRQLESALSGGERWESAVRGHSWGPWGPFRPVSASALLPLHCVCLTNRSPHSKSHASLCLPTVQLSKHRTASNALGALTAAAAACGLSQQDATPRVGSGGAGSGGPGSEGWGEAAVLCNRACKTT
jgi:hypothetical protein